MTYQSSLEYSSKHLLNSQPKKIQAELLQSIKIVLDQKTREVEGGVVQNIEAESRRQL